MSRPERLMAAFHAAEALIFERRDRAMKTHRGVRSEFSNIARFDPELDWFSVILASGYEFQTDADYGIGEAAVTSPEDAVNAIASAKRFVDVVAAKLGGSKANV